MGKHSYYGLNLMILLSYPSSIAQYIVECDNVLLPFLRKANNNVLFGLLNMVTRNINRPQHATEVKKALIICGNGMEGITTSTYFIFGHLVVC